MRKVNNLSKQFVLFLLILLLTVCVFPASMAKAESGTLSVSTGSTAEELANQLIGEGIDMSNAQLHAGIPEAVGIFSGGLDAVGFENGIILSTGKTGEVVGTYDIEPDYETGGGSDPDLDGLGMGSSNDACYLTFDIIPSGNAVSFQYVLASDEYEEYIDFADLFGLFYAEVDGSGNIIGSYQNMAWIPGTNPAQPVSVGTINQNVNTELYRSNCNGDATGAIASTMDGFTRVLSVSQTLTAGTKYRIKLAIGDISDTSVDSNVFIKANSVSGQAAEYGELSPKSKTENGDTIDVVIYRENGSDGSAAAEWQALDESRNVVASGTVVFNDGEVKKVITVPCSTVSVKLLNPSGGITIKTPEAALADLPQTVDESDASLTDLFVSIGTLEPAFEKTTKSYTVEVGNSTASIKVTPASTNPLSTITVNSANVNSGDESSAIDLIVGENDIEIVVISEDTSQTETYTIKVTRLAVPSPSPTPAASPSPPPAPSPSPPPAPSPSPTPTASPSPNTQIGNITGVLVDQNGDPISGQKIELHSDPITTITDSTGRFTFNNVPLVNHTLIVKSEDGSDIGSYSLSFEQSDSTSYSVDGSNVDVAITSITVNIDILVQIGDDGGITLEDITFTENPQTGDNKPPLLIVYISLFAMLLIMLSIVLIVRRALMAKK